MNIEVNYNALVFDADFIENDEGLMIPLIDSLNCSPRTGLFII